MIYTIGYDHMQLPDLQAIGKHFGITSLLDVRSIPFSRRPGFSRAALEKAFPNCYCWMGQDLGGRPPGVKRYALDQLALRTWDTAMLLCKEESPGDCHRYHTIALPLLRDYRVDCIHIYQDELIETSELAAAVEEDRNYLCRTFTL